jgi:hypothetical protein
MVKTPFFTQEEATARKRRQKTFHAALTSGSKNPQLAEAKAQVALLYKDLPAHKKWAFVEAWSEGGNAWILECAKGREASSGGSASPGVGSAPGTLSDPADSGAAPAATSSSASSLGASLQVGDHVRIVRSRLQEFELTDKEEQLIIFQIAAIREEKADLMVTTGQHKGRCFGFRVPLNCLFRFSG